jgi:hypothetical protein
MTAAALSWFPTPAPEHSACGLQLTRADILHLTGISAKTFERKTQQPGVIAVTPSGNGRNGKPIRRYLVASLPADLRDKVLDAYHARPKPVAVLDGKALRKAQAAAPLFSQGQFAAQEQLTAERAGHGGGPALLAELSPRDRKRAESRHAAILPLLEYELPGRRMVYSALRLQDDTAVTTKDLLARYLAETVKVEGKPVSPRTLWNWVKLWRQGGDAALGRKPRKDRGTSNFFTRYPAAARLVESEWLKPSASFTRAQNALYRDQALLRIPDAELPDLKTVTRYLKALPKPAALLARHGQKAWHDKCAPHVTRKYTDIPANGVWVSDHMIHDVEVRNDCFAGVAIDAPMRIRFTAIMDMRSRKFVGYCWAAEGDSRSIAAALRNAVARYGPPELFYCDNGKDFKKAAKGTQRLRLTPEQKQEAYRFLEATGALQQLGIPVQFCRPYSAQSKNIERGFGTMHGDFDAMLPHYTTGNAYTRPDQTILAGAEHRRLLKFGLGAASKLVPASQFIRLAQTWVEQVYNAQHAHTGKGMDGRTPNAVFDELYPPAQRRTANPEILATLLYERRKALVRKTAVTIDGERYAPAVADHETYGRFYQLNDRSVTLAFDPLDPVEAVAIDDQGNRYRLERERQTEHPAGSLTAQAPETAALIAATLQTRSRLLSATAGTVKRIHKSVAEAGHKTDLQHLAELAAQTNPVDESLISQRLIRQNTRPSEDARAPKSSHDIAAEFLGELLA